MKQTFFDIDREQVLKRGSRDLAKQERELVGNILHITDPDRIDQILFRPNEAQFRQLAAGLFGDRYSYPTPWLGPDKPIIVHCNRHDINFPIDRAHWHTHGLIAQVCPLCLQEQIERDFLQPRVEETKRQIERISRRTVELPVSEAQPAIEDSQDYYDSLLTAFAMKGEA